MASLGCDCLPFLRHFLFSFAWFLNTLLTVTPVLHDSQRDWLTEPGASSSAQFGFPGTGVAVPSFLPESGSVLLKSRCLSGAGM